MPDSLTSNRSIQERVIDVILFLLSQTITPTSQDWYDAVDDMFGEFSESEKRRLVEAGILILERKISSEPYLFQSMAA